MIDDYIIKSREKINSQKNVWMNIYNRLQSNQNIGMSREDFIKLVAETICIFNAKIYSIDKVFERND